MSEVYEREMKENKGMRIERQVFAVLSEEEE